MSMTETKRLGDVLTEVKRQEAVEPDRLYPLLGVRLNARGSFHRETKLGAQLSAKKLRRVEAGDFIYSRLFAWRGAFGVVPPEQDGHYVSNEFPTFRPKRNRDGTDQIDLGYLELWFRLPTTIARVEDDCAGTTKQSRNRFKESFFKALTLPVPCLSDQKRLAAEALSALQKASLLDERFGMQKSDLAALRQRILDDAVRGRLTERDSDDEPAEVLLKRIAAEKQRRFKAGEIRKPKALPPVVADEVPFEVPAGWGWTRMNDLFDIRGGIQKTPRRTPVANPHPYVGVANVQRNALDLRDVKEFELFEGELEKWRLAASDLLIVEGNGSENEIGRCALWNDEIADCVHQNHLIRCRPPASESRAALSRYVALCLNSPHGIDEMKRRAVTTSGLYNLSVGKIQTILIPLAPATEQRQIVERVDALMVLCDQLEARLNAATEDAGRLAQSVLAEALADAQTAP